MGESVFRSFARNWREDAGFRSRVAADPRAALDAAGLELPAGVKRVRVVEDTPETVHLVLPPESGALSDDALEAVYGGLAGVPPGLGRRP